MILQEVPKMIHINKALRVEEAPKSIDVKKLTFLPLHFIDLEKKVSSTGE